jgi:hypothetical protein
LAAQPGRIRLKKRRELEGREKRARRPALSMVVSRKATKNGKRASRKSTAARRKRLGIGLVAARSGRI